MRISERRLSNKVWNLNHANNDAEDAEQPDIDSASGKNSSILKIFKYILHIFLNLYGMMIVCMGDEKSQITPR